MFERIKQATLASNHLEARFFGALVMGRHYEEVERNLEQAYAQVKQAVEFYEIVRGNVPSGEDRINFVGYRHSPFQIAVILAMKLGRRIEAFDLVNRSKSRQMLETLAESLPRPKTSANSQAILDKERDQFEQWTKAVRRLKTPVPDRPDQSSLQNPTATSEDIWQLRDELNRLWAELEQTYPDYASLRRGSPLHFSEVRHILSGTQTTITDLRG